MKINYIILNFLLAGFVFSNNAIADYRIVNLTTDISGGAGYPSLNNNGQVAYQIIIEGNDIDLFLDGVNLTPNTYNEFNGIPSLNDKGDIAWQRWYSANSPLSGQSKVIVNGSTVAGGGTTQIYGPKINNKGQIAWEQWSGGEWDLIFDGVNLTNNLPGNVNSFDLNDLGDIAWIQPYVKWSLYVNGIERISTTTEIIGPLVNNIGQLAWVQATGPNEYDIFLDGVNLTASIPGHAEGPSLNDKGQVAWRQVDGEGNSDIYVDGYNLTAGFSFWHVRDALSPSINDKGQIAWSMDGDIYLATPIYALAVLKAGLGTGTVTSGDGGINCGTTCSASYDVGTNVNLAATANQGSTFTGWIGGGCSGTGTCQVTIDADKSVTANFVPLTHSITTSVNPAGAGTVSCTSNPVPHGGESTCTANAAAGYTFTSWIGNCSIAVGNICTLSNVTSDQTLTANFDLAGPALSIYDVSKAEGNKGTTSFTFTIILNPASTQKVTVQYAAADNGSATAGSDYTATSGTLTFKAGQTSKTVTVKVNGDKVIESDETFVVNLSNASKGASIRIGQGIGTIVNDDGL